VDFFLDRQESPIGTILLVTDGAALRALDFLDFEPRMRRLIKLHYGLQPLLEKPENLGVKRRLLAYFSGDLNSLDNVIVRTEGTAFQRRVWAQLREIPPGRTISYGELAKRIGRPSASRAVGLANGSNPIAIVVPCHRVIGSTGALTGYGGGIERKRWLLQHEAAHT
jgi:methylated-DNA-[protein]-cysteine S-methyltransferase